MATKTPVSGTAAYCTVGQFLNWFDQRVVGDLVMDDGSRNSSLTTNAVLLQILQEASGDVEAAVMLGNRYAVADLQALAANTNGGIFLAGIVAGLAFAKLLERRPDLEYKEPDRTKKARAAVIAISSGDAILPFQETQAAGEIEEDVETVTDVDNRTMVSWHTRRYLGRRTARYVLSKSGGFSGGFMYGDG